MVSAGIANIPKRTRAHKCHLSACRVSSRTPQAISSARAEDRLRGMSGVRRHPHSDNQALVNRYRGEPRIGSDSSAHRKKESGQGTLIVQYRPPRKGYSIYGLFYLK